MKKIIILFISLIPATGFSQIVLENSYIGTVGNPSGYIIQEKVINLSLGGYKYAIAYYAQLPLTQPELRLYNINHTLWKVIPLPLPPTCIGNFHEPDNIDYTHNLPYLQYISDGLFDTDSLIEMVINWTDPVNNPSTIINIVYKENGDTLLHSNYNNSNCQVSRILNVYKTDINTFKLMAKVRYQTYDSVNVYTLLGTIPCDPCGTHTFYSNEENETASFKGYPNPTSNYFNIDYELPKGIKDGKIEFYNLQGQLIKIFKVDNAFKNIRLSISDISPGTYLYQLKNEQGIIGSQKMIVIK